jgi:hypothetical protein
VVFFEWFLQQLKGHWSDTEGQRTRRVGKVSQGQEEVKHRGHAVPGPDSLGRTAAAGGKGRANHPSRGVA